MTKEFEIKALDNGILDAVRSVQQLVAGTDVKRRLLASRGSTSTTQSLYDILTGRIVEESNTNGIMSVYSKGRTRGQA